MPRTQTSTFRKRSPRKSSLYVAVSVHSLNDVVSVAEDGVSFSFEIREEFAYLCQKFRQGFLVLEFERMVGDCELIAKLIYDFNEVPLSPGC